MSAEWGDGIASKACSRCRKQKRKCDRELPKCSLCTRLHQICKYETAASPSVTSDPTQEILPSSPNHIKTAIIQKLGNRTPNDVAQTYSHTIKPWFPVISDERLCNQLPNTWDDASLDFTLLSFSIILLGPVPGSTNSVPNDLMSLYLCAKSWTAIVEGSGLLSLDIVQSRLLITLFEVAHGFYPAAYISIGATVRAADAMAVFEGTDAVLIETADMRVKAERMMTWCGIVILDRYIAISSGKWPPVTRGRACPDLPPSIYSAASVTASSSSQEFLRLFESSNLVDKIHTALHETTLQHSFPIQEMMLNVKALSSLETILYQDIPEKSKLYASSLSICLGGLLLAFENGSKAFFDDEDTTECRKVAGTSLHGLFEVICRMIEPFISGRANINADVLSPFVTYLLFKSASILTENLRSDNPSIGSLRRLGSLRYMLTLISRRWRCGERYLDLLNEDTTPRILKALESI